MPNALQLFAVSALIGECQSLLASKALNSSQEASLRLLITHAQAAFDQASAREGGGPSNTRHWHVVSKWLDSRASFPIATRLHGKPRVSTQLCGVSFSFHKRILERHAIRIVLGEPGVGSVLGGEHPEVMLVADLLASVDVDPDRDCLLR